MLISHEVPAPLLEKSREWNDYDYALLHLIQQNEEYAQFYKDSVAMGRKVILDNSIIELGEALDIHQVAAGVDAIKPTVVVVPDSFGNAQQTMDWFEEWEYYYNHLDVKTMGVVQGSTYAELIECYKFMAEHADIIAIPFGLPVWESWWDHQVYMPVAARKSYGRYMFISLLSQTPIWCKDKPHHLLGCNCAWEFEYPLYREIINSVDTSHPIMAGIGCPFGEYNIYDKPIEKFKDWQFANVDEDQLRSIEQNVKIFRTLCGGGVLNA